MINGSKQSISLDRCCPSMRCGYFVMFTCMYLRLRTELSLELAQGLGSDNPALRDWAERGRGEAAPGA